MPASRVIAIVLAVAVLAIGGLSAAYIIFNQSTSNRGLHVRLSIDAGELRDNGLDDLLNEARQRLGDAKIAFDGLGIVDGAVQLRIAKPDEVDAALKELRALGQTGGIEVGSGEGGRITLTQTQAGLDDRLSKATASTIDILRRRFDAAGISIRRIQQEGKDRIHVHAMAPEDASRLKELIGQGGRLSLHEVHPSVGAQEALSGRLPAGYRIYRSSDKQAEPFLLRAAPAVRGDELADAQSSFDARTSQPMINFRLNAVGARKLGAFTASNVGRPLAIVIDDRVISTPVIREPILGGSGQISGNFTVADAQQLAITLKSGALPAKLTVIEERVVTGQ